MKLEEWLEEVKRRYGTDRYKGQYSEDLPTLLSIVGIYRAALEKITNYGVAVYKSSELPTSFLPTTPNMIAKTALQQAEKEVGSEGK